MKNTQKLPGPLLPTFREVAIGLTQVSRPRLVVSLSLPFAWAACYFLFATLSNWPLAVLSLVALSFVTYGSISHDLVHANLGLEMRTNGFLLTFIELLAIRSGHAYRLAHLHHHARFPHDDDIEGTVAGMSLGRTLLAGVRFQFRVYAWALQHAGKERALILVEGCACALIVAFALATLPITLIFFVYALLMIMGSWAIPFVTSYVPHVRNGVDSLHQTRRFRGKVASLVALEHLYHLEHHLYPAVPHHHWPALARRLDPYLDAAGIVPVKFGF